MKDKIRCLKCGSTQIKRVEGADDFLAYKGEGKPAKRQAEKTKQKYICLEENCRNEWEEDLY